MAEGTHDDVRWLDATEASAWLPLLSLSMWLTPALDVQLQRDAGLSNFEYAVLAALSEAEGRRRRLRDLARVANSTLPRLSKVVDRFEAQGWVERAPDPTDGRSTLAVLTDAGWQKVVETAPGHVGRVRELVFDQLTPAQVEQLAAIAGTLAAACGPDGGCASRAR